MPDTHTRRIKIRNLEPVKIYNTTRKNFKLLSKKPYNKNRGKYGVIYGFQKSTGKYIVNVGKNRGVVVNANNVEFLNSPNFKSTPCELCGRKPHEHTEEELFSEMEKVVKGRNMSEELYVPQDNFKITPKNSGLLYTYGLATCTALGFKLENKQFLAHISAGTNVDIIIKEVLSLNKKPTEVEIWTGVGDDAKGNILLNNPSERSLKKVYTITDALGIKRKDIKVHDVCYAEIVP
jgi:hypothetical protein